MNKYEFLEVLHTSASNEIYKVRSLDDNQVYTMKVFYGAKSLAINELQMLKQFQQDFVVKIQQHHQDEKGRMVLIMEYCDQKDLQFFVNIHMGNFIQEAVICRFFIQLLYIMVNMHNHQFLHRGIIPENILIISKSQGEEIRLTDFVTAGQNSSNQVSTINPALLPPEYLFKNEFNQKSQVWQLGLVLYMLSAQKNLFNMNDGQEKIKNLIRKKGYHIKVPTHFSRYLRNIIHLCLQVEEQDRPNVKQLINNTNTQFILKQEYYKFSYDQQQNFNLWIKPTKQELQKHISTIIQDKNINYLTVTSNAETSKLNFQSQQKHKNSPSLQSLQYPAQKIRTVQDHFHTKSQINLFQRPYTNQSNLFTEIPFKPQTAFAFQSSTKLPHFNLRSKRTTSMDDYQEHILRASLPIQKSNEPLIKITKKANSSIISLIQQKYSLCVEVIGKNQTDLMLLQIRNDMSKFKPYVQAFQYNSSTERIMDCQQYLIDIVELQQDLTNF